MRDSSNSWQSVTFFSFTGQSKDSRIPVVLYRMWWVSKWIMSAENWSNRSVVCGRKAFFFIHASTSLVLNQFVRKLFRCSLRSKRFRAVSEQRKTEERDSRFWPPEKWNERQKKKEGALTRAIFRVAFAPKQHGNACFAGYFRCNPEGFWFRHKTDGPGGSFSAYCIATRSISSLDLCGAASVGEWNKNCILSNELIEVELPPGKFTVVIQPLWTRLIKPNFCYQEFVCPNSLKLWDLRDLVPVKIFPVQ